MSKLTIDMIPTTETSTLVTAMKNQCAKWSPMMPLSAALLAMLAQPQQIPDSVVRDAATAWLRVGGWLEVEA